MGFDGGVLQSRWSGGAYRVTQYRGLKNGYIHVDLELSEEQRVPRAGDWFLNDYGEPQQARENGLWLPRRILRVVREVPEE